MATRINTATATDDGPISTLASSSFDLTEGNFVIVGVGWEDLNSLASVTDDAGNTYTLLTQSGTTEAFARLAYCYRCRGKTGNIVRANMSGATEFVRLIVAQYSGAAIQSILDTEVGNSSTTPATNFLAGDLVTAIANDILIVIGKGYTTGTFTPATNWTEITEVGNHFAMSERFVSSTGTYAASQTFSVNSSWAARAAAIKATPPSVALTGTVTASIDEADIVAGGKTIILTLTDGVWAPSS